MIRKYYEYFPRFTELYPDPTVLMVEEYYPFTLKVYPPTLINFFALIISTLYGS